MAANRATSIALLAVRSQCSRRPLPLLPTLGIGGGRTSGRPALSLLTLSSLLLLLLLLSAALVLADGAAGLVVLEPPQAEMGMPLSALAQRLWRRKGRGDTMQACSTL